MTILPFIHSVKKPDKQPVDPPTTGPQPVKVSNGPSTVMQSDTVILIPKRSRKKKTGFWQPAAGACSRTGWITVGFFSFAFVMMMVIQYTVGYLAYNGYGARKYYGIVLNGGDEGSTTGVAYSWPHLPWKCSPEVLTPLEDNVGHPLVLRHKKPIFSEGFESVMDHLGPLLTHAALQIPTQRREDATVYIMGGLADDGGSDGNMDHLMRGLKEDVKKVFNFNLEYVNDASSVENDFGDFLTKAEKHLQSVMQSSKCVNLPK